MNWRSSGPLPAKLWSMPSSAIQICATVQGVNSGATPISLTLSSRYLPISLILASKLRYASLSRGIEFAAQTDGTASMIEAPCWIVCTPMIGTAKAAASADAPIDEYRHRCTRLLDFLSIDFEM